GPTTLPAPPGTTPTKAPTTVAVHTTSPTPTPSTSTSPPPPPDTIAPTIGAVSTSPEALEAAGCTYGNRASTVTTTVTDNKSGPAALKVSFRYTLGSAASTVPMTSVGKGVFQGTIGNLSMPETATRIPIYVVAVDAAGNSATSGKPA